jgi:L-lactate dehydrogenase
MSANAGLIMKIGIIGAGRVGCACALAAVVRGSAGVIVMVDRTRKRAKAVATDLRYGTPLCPNTTIVDGDYEGLGGCCAGDDRRRNQ